MRMKDESLREIGSLRLRHCEPQAKQSRGDTGKNGEITSALPRNDRRGVIASDYRERGNPTVFPGDYVPQRL